MYNIPQTAFEDALKEGEVESESEAEEEKEMELEGEDDGPHFIAADSDESSDENEIMDLVNINKFNLLFIPHNEFIFQDSDSGDVEKVDLDSDFESSDSDIEVSVQNQKLKKIIYNFELF